jgi:hypothetical protein
MRLQYVVGMFDGADDEDVSAHDGNVPPSRAEGMQTLVMRGR